METNIEKIIFNLSPDTINTIISNSMTNTSLSKMCNNYNIISVINSNKDIIEGNWEMNINSFYTSILENISYVNGIYIDYDNLSDNDLYTLTLSLYDILISNSYDILKNFIINYINDNKYSLCKLLELDKLKKNKDVDIMYNSSIVEDKDIALILSKLNLIINTIFSIDINDIDLLKIAGYNSNKLETVIRFTNMNNTVFPKYKNIFKNNDLIKATIINDIKLHFHNKVEFNTLMA